MTPWTAAYQAPHPWDFPGKNTGVSGHFLLQGIFPTQGSNLRLLCLLHWQIVSLPLCHLGKDVYVYTSVQFSRSVVSGDPMDCSMPGFPVHHQFPELIQTHVHRVGDAIQPSLPLSSPSPPAFNLSQHQGLFHLSQFFTSGAKVLEFQLHRQSFQ